MPDAARARPSTCYRHEHKKNIREVAIIIQIGLFERNIRRWIQPLHMLRTEKTISPISFRIEWDMIVIRQFSISIFWTKWNSIWLRKSKGKLSPRSCPIQYERKRKYSFFSVGPPNEGLPKTARTSQHYGIEGFQGGRICNYFPSGYAARRIFDSMHYL